MKFADYIGMLAESVEELTFEKLKKELKAGKKFNWKNKGYIIVLDKFGKVLVGYDVGGKKENWVGIDKDNFGEYAKDIFEDGKKLDEAKDTEDGVYEFQISGYFDGDLKKKIQHTNVKGTGLDCLDVSKNFKKENPKAVILSVQYV